MTTSKKVTTIELKFTAAQIETDCPLRLQQISHEITERLAKADKQAQDANDHLIAIEQLLAEAKTLCDGGGFKKFRDLFCPQLGKSQAYALLAIAAGKTTLIAHRTEERERKRRTRAKQKAASAANSGTVPETSEPEPQGAPIGEDMVETASIVPEQTPESAKPRKPVQPKDDALFGFTAAVLDLDRRTAKQKPGRFAATTAPADMLTKLGKFLTEVANLKKGGASKPPSTVALHGTSTVPAEQSAEDPMAKDEAHEASGAATAPPVAAKSNMQSLNDGGSNV
jgi:hypothetical protein